MLNIITIILTVLAFALVVARPLAPVIVTWLDRPEWERWAWLPPAVVLALSVLWDGLAHVLGAEPVFSPEVQRSLDSLRVVVDAGLAFAVAYQRGHEAGPKTAPKPLDRIGPAALLVLLVAVGLAGCRPGQAAAAQRDFCSDSAYKAVTSSCALAELRAPDLETLAAVSNACHRLVDAQDLVCRGSR